MITIVIPSYNHAHYLPTMIASIILQGTIVSKIIVVNDGSSDNTAEVLAKIQINEPRLMVKNLTKNVGWVQAQHIGLSYVETEFFSFSAADDFIMPGWAEKSLNALRNAPGIGMCLSPTFVIKEKSKAVTKAIFPKKLRGVVLKPADFHQSVMRYGNWMESNGMLIRRSKYDERSVEFGPAGAFADGVTMYVIGLNAGAVLLDDPTTVFFERETSISGVTVAPGVGKTYLQELSKLFKTSPCIELIDRRLALRILRRNTYTYLVSSVHHLTSEFLQINEKILPPFASRALQLSLLLFFKIYRFTAFLILRPFDFMLSREIHSHQATLDEKNAISEYRKVLNDTLPSIGLDI